MGRGWADIHMVKGVFVRFGFDAIRTSQLQTDCQKQSNAERLMRCIIYCPHWLRTFYRSLSRVHSIYLHWRGAFGVARFGKLGDARASTRGTSDRIGSTLFRMY